MTPLLQYFTTIFPLLLLLLLLTLASAQSKPSANIDTKVPIHISISVVVGVFVVMFSLTFLLLMYVKYCHPAPTTPTTAVVTLGDDNNNNHHRSSSGIDKSIINSLPFFLFSSLKGSRHGLECAVCLSKFSDDETLRLLPKCKHAFHVACVDHWLESHSTCPLCRNRVDPDDVEILKCYSTSQRLLNTSIVLGESRTRSIAAGSARLDIDDDDGHVEIFVEREQMLDKFEHKIVVSDVAFKSRWSDVDLSDIEAMNEGFDDEESKDSRMLIKSPMNRCMSEIADGSRFQQGIRGKRGLLKSWEGAGGDEKVRRVWLPIARRTVQRFAGSVGRFQLPQPEINE